MASNDYHEEKCAVCDHVVHSYYHSNGYGEHSHGHVRHKVYDKRQVSTPENHSFEVLVCEDCTNNTQALKVLINKERIIYTDKQIKRLNDNLLDYDAEIEAFERKKSKIHDEIDELNKKRESLRSHE